MTFIVYIGLNKASIRKHPYAFTASLNFELLSSVTFNEVRDVSSIWKRIKVLLASGGGGGALGYFLGGYVPPGTPNWHPVLKKNSAKIDTPF